MPLIAASSLPTGNLKGADHGATISQFTNNGPGPANLVCIHASPTFVTEWLQ